VGRKPIGTAAMTGAERVQRYRLKHASVTKHNEIQEKGPCKYCSKPGEQIKGIGYADEGEEPKQLYVCQACLIAALALYKKSRSANLARH
jgi:hypothetical protein